MSSDSTDPTLEPRSIQMPAEDAPATRGATLVTGGSTVPRLAPPPSLIDIPGYEVLDELGHGGMGVVYKARQIKANRLVALKMILASRHATIEAKVRFQIEAEAVARLVHPNIVQLHDVGEHEGLPFFSLEFCGGGSLDCKLKSWTPSPAEAAELAETLARAMHFAHLRGVVHRDLKPANVLFSEWDAEGTNGTDAADGNRSHSSHAISCLKITDFGLAKRIDLGTDDLSKSGAVMGTPAYMAPEQAAGKVHDTGPAADVYALGVILYETLCGRVPFRGETQFETIHQLMLDDPTPPSRIRPGVPRDLETVCLKCLHKEPERRYASAEDLADDLRRWRAGEPIAARPVGMSERLVKWVKRQPALAGLMAALAVVIAVSFGLVAWQLGQTQTALERVKAEEEKRARARIDALREAAPGAAPGILAELEASREDVLPRLRELWQEQGDARKRMRIGLALLRSEPETVRDELARAMLGETDPAEMLLLRDNLAPHGAKLSERMWRTAEDVKDPSEERFRALIGLAVFDAGSERWRKAAPAAVEQMLSANPLYQPAWMQALRSVRAALLEPLGKAYRTEKLPERREFAARVLADYAADNPAVLSERLLEADPRQYAILFPVLRQHREQAIERMRREARGEGYWNDASADPAWEKPAGELAAAIEAAGGLLEERWALCQSLPLELWEAVAEGLRTSGYRPVRLRPWQEGETAGIAAIWSRDGREGKSAAGLTAQALGERNAALAKDGFLPLDVSAYGPESACRFAALWVKGPPGATARLETDVPGDKQKQTQDGFTSQGFVPVAVHSRLGEDGRPRVCGIWWKANTPPRNCLLTLDDEDAHQGRVLLAEKMLADVALTGSKGGRYASIWCDDPARESAEAHGLSVEAHRERCRELASHGYRPAALSVVSNTVTASAWHRPALKREEREQKARRQATAAVTLLKMDAPEDTWPLFRHWPDSETRSQLIWRTGQFKADPKPIVQRLYQEKDGSAKRALILALGEFTGEQLPAAEREPLAEKLLGWYRDDPDPGLHSAIGWLLRHGKEGPVSRPLDWGLAAKLKETDEELKRRDASLASRGSQPPGGRRWYVNGQGQTMVLIPGPVDFRMGSPLSDPARFSDETPHRRRIPRSFAIAGNSVTVEEYQRFLKDRSDVMGAFPKQYSPDPDGPAISVTWFMAAQYCNWLSEKEGLPESEWCYPKHADIKEGMKPYPDFLKRKGYRLPTDAEWEYAARAGSVTSRYYGASLELLPRYAWFLHNSTRDENSDNRAWPVGQKRPNDLGVSDALGNVWNWVVDPGNDLPAQQGTAAVADVEDLRAIKADVERVLRGASFGVQPMNLRLALRNTDLGPKVRSNAVGLRPARTHQ